MNQYLGAKGVALERAIFDGMKYAIFVKSRPASHHHIRLGQAIGQEEAIAARQSVEMRNGKEPEADHRPPELSLEALLERHEPQEKRAGG